MTVVSRIPLKGFLYANLAIGLLVVLANGAAIALVLAGRGGSVSERIPEMMVWLSAGVLLLAGGGYAFFRSAYLAVLRFQLFVVLALVVGIAGRAVLALMRASTVDTQMVWGLGFFTVLVVYTVALLSRVFDAERYRWVRTASVWIAIPLAVLLDVAMAFRG